MTDTAFGPSGRSAQRMLKVEILQPLLERRRPRRVLLLSHALAEDLPLPQPPWPLQLIRLGGGQAQAPLRCRTEALPFEAGVFDLVVLLHLVSDGGEAVLGEALRVLMPGGELVVSGLNAYGAYYRLGNRARQFPGLRMHRLNHRLQAKSFVVVHCLRAGLLGFPGPVFRRQWQGLMLPCADHIALHAHHHCGTADSLRFKQVRAPGAASVAFESCHRRTAAS